MRLIIVEGELAGQEFALGRPMVVIGRGRQSDIVLAEQGISRQHASIQHGPQGWILTDLGSTNGTLLNGQPIRAQEPYLLRPGDRVAIGSSVMLLQQDAPQEAAAPPAHHRDRPRPALLIAGAFFLVVVLAGIVALLVTVLKPDEEATTPESIDPLEGIGTVLPIPTALQDLVTALPIPTQLEDLATALPVPTQLEDIATSLPVPTQLQEIATSIVPSIPIDLPGLPIGATATPAPASHAPPQPAAHLGDGGASP
jgi:predicted component of type VI protein secretion system